MPEETSEAIWVLQKKGRICRVSEEYRRAAVDRRRTWAHRRYGDRYDGGQRPSPGDHHHRRSQIETSKDEESGAENSPGGRSGHL